MAVTRWICATCGVEYSASEAPPDACPICEDERQYVGHGGQVWTTQAQMASQGFRNELLSLEPGLTSIRTQPSFGIGQQAMLIRAPGGNILWDCISCLNEETARAVAALGGIRAISVNHPHFYAAVATWAERFGAEIHLPAVDREWVMCDRERIRFWEGDRFELAPGLTIHRLGGHFPGSTVLQWRAGAGGRGALFTGDTVTVAQDRDWVSFLYSYPNLIPLPAHEVARIGERLQEIPFDRIYGGWHDKAILEGARAKVARSVARYIAAITSDESRYD